VRLDAGSIRSPSATRGDLTMRHRVIITLAILVLLPAAASA
jgi:hypothetical protein